MAREKFLRKPVEASRFIRRLQFELARILLRRVRSACPSKTLKNALQFFETYDGKAVIAVPHYWAAYFNDGHGGFGPIGGKFLVWFRDALSDDPRLGGQYPIRYDEWRHLTKEEFQAGIDINKALGGPPMAGPFMVAVGSIGPQSGTHFFEQGFMGFLASGGSDLIQRRFRTFVKRFIINEKDTIKVPPIEFSFDSER